MNMTGPPPMIMHNIEGQKIPINDTLEIDQEGENIHTYLLCGVIYLGGFHFTSRIIDKKRKVWYYDGAENPALLGNMEGQLENFDRHSLLHCKGRKASMVLYVLDKTTRIVSE